MVAAGDRSLTYQQSPATVTASEGGTKIATVALARQSWTGRSAHLELRVTTRRLE